LLRGLTKPVLASSFLAMWECKLESPSATQKLGERIGTLAEAGAVVALVGDLGAGKTCLSQGIARGLGIVGPVTSPTFVIVAAYPDARLPFFHADFYRLGDESELAEIGLGESMGEEGGCVIEWADLYLDMLPEDHLLLALRELDPETRRLVATAHGPKSHALLEAIRFE